MADPATDAAIAIRFPSEWARANDTRLRNRSKARQQLRQRYRIALEMDALRAANPHAKCANCSNRGSWNGKMICDLDSDFGGYAITDPASLCVRWKAEEMAS